jgi:hypothetical protein
MQTAGSSELGYANTALITALFDVLADKGILTATDLEMIARTAIRNLEPTQHNISVNGAINFIKGTIIPQIRKHGAA